MSKAPSITPEIIEESLSYESYNQRIISLFEKGRTTNDDNSESQLNITKLNLQRINRLDKRSVLEEPVISYLKNIDRKLIWLVLSEGWCGDSAQILPYINKMARLNNNISLKLLFRDEHEEVMDDFLTDGKSRSIPKIIILEENTLNTLGSWGPRPVQAQNRFMEERADPEIGPKLASKNLHSWYAKNKGVVIQQEFISYLKSVI